MIPFENERSLNSSEEYAKQILKNNWDYVVRSTPGIVDDLNQRFDRLAETVSRNIREDTNSKMKNVFRSGVPDFLAFDDSGSYLFVEVKKGEDGLRHSQLKWLRDFEGVNAELWFAKEKEIEDKLDITEISAYSFEDKKKGDKSKVVDNKGLKVELPKNLASIVNVSEGDNVKWRLKSKDELILDKR